VPLLTTDLPRLRLTEDLARVCAASHTGPLRLSAVLSSADDRGFALVLLLATFPFVLPFPTLGLATPVGFALALAAIGLVLGRPAALPASLGALEIGPAALARAVSVVSRASWVLARVARPRMPFMLGGRTARGAGFTPDAAPPCSMMGRGMRIALGLSLFTAAVVLGLPIPLPLSNFFPAVAIILLAAGMIEGDGLLVLAGHVATLAVCAVVGATCTTVVALGARVFG
jgi:hypothetical protein